MKDKLSKIILTLVREILSSSGSDFIIASGCGANMAHVTVALCALMPSQKSLRSRRTYLETLTTILIRTRKNPRAHQSTTYRT